MKNFLPKEYKKNQKLKINHSYLVEQFADYTKIFKEVVNFNSKIIELKLIEINIKFLWLYYMMFFH